MVANLNGCWLGSVHSADGDFCDWKFDFQEELWEDLEGAMGIWCEGSRIWGFLIFQAEFRPFFVDFCSLSDQDWLLPSPENGLLDFWHGYSGVCPDNCHWNILQFRFQGYADNRGGSDWICHPPDVPQPHSSHHIPLDHDFSHQIPLSTP